MVRHDDICYHCHRCGRDLRDDEVEYLSLYCKSGEVPVCDYCLQELIDGLEAYERDPWYDNGVSIRDFVRE